MRTDWAYDESTDPDRDPCFLHYPLDSGGSSLEHYSDRAEQEKIEKSIPLETKKQYPTSLKVNFVGQPHAGVRCPICAYAEKLEVSELMPLFRELDEVMITLRHGVPRRERTLAGGGAYCDYCITGDKA